MSKKRSSGASEDAATSAEVRPQQPDQTTPVTDPERKPVDAWAAEVPEATEATWKYAAARQLHAWAACEHHTGKPLVCTREDFLAALKAVEAPGPSKHYAPHKPALFTLTTRSADQ